jgi:hypothetical protein
VDFFDAGCQSGPFTDAQFGICDDRPGLPSYVDPANTSKWIATVHNKAQVPVTFTAIDKCVIQDGDEIGRGRCDAMLTTPNLLYLLELKDQNSGGWKAHAIRQLESTIQFLLQHHAQAVNQYRHKKAFACNRKHQPFQTIDNDQQNHFFSNYRFRLDVQATVVVVE